MISYLALRSFDMRDVQRKLGYLGMSRLARAEAHVEASLKMTLFFLDQLLGEDVSPPGKHTISIKSSEKLLKRHTAQLLGEAPGNRRLRIMVTIPSKAVKNYTLVEQMIASGMNCARINCAHDGPEDWLKMIEHIKKASAKLQRRVTITMDVGGPKIRTGEIEGGPKIRHFLPLRDEYGHVVHPAVIYLVSGKKQDLKAEELFVDDDWLRQLSVGDVISFKDTRDKKRELKVLEISDKGAKTCSYDSAYIVSGTKLRTSFGETEIGEIPPIDQALFLRDNDQLVVHRAPIKGRPAQYNKKGELTDSAHISCSLPEVFDDLEPGDRIFFDDGEIRGTIEQKHPDHLLVRIIQAKSGGTKLATDKGINFPDSNVKLSGLTAKDKEDLKFIAAHADAVNYSFVNTPEDVQEMLGELERLGLKDQLGIILKIETQKAYDNLTKILLEAMKTSKIGVMIARGDMAIEAGWERMGSIQREMLAICNASHVPVIWATQVLENLAKKGLPSRSEITDAVNATKAECVMLNKGPHILQAIQLLNQLIESSEIYQDKNAPVLPKLKRISKKK